MYSFSALNSELIACNVHRSVGASRVCISQFGPHSNRSVLIRLSSGTFHAAARPTFRPFGRTCGRPKGSRVLPDDGSHRRYYTRFYDRTVGSDRPYRRTAPCGQFERTIVRARDVKHYYARPFRPISAISELHCFVPESMDHPSRVCAEYGKSQRRSIMHGVN